MAGDLCASACGIHIFAHFDCLVETGPIPTTEIEGGRQVLEAQPYFHISPQL
jgi:hypothetical protein